jgi:hypothetical protein
MRDECRKELDLRRGANEFDVTHCSGPSKSRRGVRLTSVGSHFHRVDDNPSRFNFFLTPLNGKQAVFP